MHDKDNIAYAAEQTEILYASEQKLETFGETVVHYYVLSHLLDEVGQVRIREGQIRAGRPQVITPRYFLHQLLENFGEDAQEYADRLVHSAEGIRILKYGLRFVKQEYSEETSSGDIHEIGDSIARRVQETPGELSAVIIGVDDLWEVSLLKFASGLVEDSAADNFSDLSDRGLLQSSSHGIPNAVRIEIESDFRRAEGDRTRIDELGRKLREYGLFAEYEDRFYRLHRSVR